MPAFLAIAGVPAMLGAITAGGVTAGATIYGAKKTSSAARAGAKAQTDAANHSADVEAQSARDALDFEKQEAARKAAADEANRKANYDQWAAFMTAHNAARARYGYSTTPIPAYVPGMTPPSLPSKPNPTTGIPPSVPGVPPASNPNSVFTPPRSIGSSLMPGVPPGSVPANGINPDPWGYQTPDDRLVRGRRAPMAPMALRTRSVGSSLMGVA